MKNTELKEQIGVIFHEGHMRSNDLRKGLADLSLVEADEEALLDELNPELENFLVNEPQPFYDIINLSALLSMNEAAQLITHLQDGIGGRPNDRKKPSNG